MAERSALSGLVVPVPEAEPVVAAHRSRLDANAALGVPAHVTALFPFVSPADLTADVLARVARVVSAVPTFDHRFGRTDWFGDDVLWLAPDDPAPFVELTERLHAEFPDHPPFGGAFPEVVPHLTVGHGHPRPALTEAELAVRAGLPVSGTATAVHLLTEDEPGGRWTLRARFPLRSR
ncbi:2'-5' RNA ligase family protein [Modestobacter muralis]|uniref:2'-5' RNA ligase family protein n=1 Tax=Modestobacter muralis TaxID=1608614 RepID=A0A6P0H9B6_9ACTN|nr:2'-5' RNA ligase family protein [Modestobacter muralis]NEK95434.1 2'-5' RNA ligase family protein [Modestobacter muralis]NEN52322.1 2'-5' RNA ligase family protein [Modestobacter muralis]